MENTALSLEEIINLLHNHPEIISSEIWTKQDLGWRVKEHVSNYYEIDNPTGETIKEILINITNRIWDEEQDELKVIPNEYHDPWCDIVSDWLETHYEEFNLKEWGE